jgi:hypothetical protein
MKRKRDICDKIAGTIWLTDAEEDRGERKKFAKRIRRALQKAATHAMEAERMRVVTILNDLTVKYKPSSTPWQVVQIVRENVTGPMSGAPKKGATK